MFLWIAIVNKWVSPHLLPDDGSPLKHAGSLISMLLIMYSVGIYSVTLVIKQGHILCVQLYQAHHRQWMLSTIHVTHKSIPEDSRLLRCYAVSLVLQSAMFWTAAMPSKHWERNSNTAHRPRRPKSQKCHIPAVVTDIQKQITKNIYSLTSYNVLCRHL